MGLGRCLVLHFGTKSSPLKHSQCWMEKRVVRSETVSNHEILGAFSRTTTRGGFEDRGTGVCLRLLRGTTSQRNGSVLCWNKIWEGRRKVQRAGMGKVANLAMSAAGEDDDEAQRPCKHDANAAVPFTYACMYVKNTVSSGETINYQGTVVVLGDVSQGGIVMADGDIIVLGRLQGDVHGGQSGDKAAIVYASQLDAREIRIADTTASPSEAYFAAYPAIASIQEDGTVGIRAAVEGRNDKEDVGNPSIFNPLKGDQGTSKIMDQKKALKRPARMALFTGVYITIVGMALLLFPTSLFGLVFDVRSVTVGWIRVGAILAVVFGVYYIGTSVGDMRGISGAWAFYMSTVVGRMFLFFGFCWLVAVRAAQPALLLVGAVNMVGAMLMLVALRQASKATALNT